jgi:hypothetical protein
MDDLVKIAVGERYPFEDVLQKILGGDGAALDYIKENKQISLYVTLNHPTKREISAFSEEIKFSLYRNHLLGTSIILVRLGAELIFDLVYDINVLDMDMQGEVKSNIFSMFLLDSKTGIVHGIRTIGLGQKFLQELNHITKNDGRYTTAEYNEWLNSDVYKKPLSQLWQESERIAWNE